MNVSLSDNASYHDSRGFGNESDWACTGASAGFPSPGGQYSESHLLAGTTKMDRYIVTRASLADPSVARKPVVLLTGAWPHGAAKSVVELDFTIDRRFTWIDREAERLAKFACGQRPDCGVELPAPWVNVLALRYYLVRLLRVIEFFTKVQPPKKGERVGVIAHKADRDDVAIITAICRREGAACSVQWHGEQAEAEQPKMQREEWWRRVLRRLAGQLTATDEQRAIKARVVLCGNPRFLDSLGHVLHERNCRLWWLYDRLAVKSFLRWSRKGVEQLTCQESLHATRQREPIELPPLEFRGVDLSGLVAAWLTTRLESRWDEQKRWEEQIDRHFQRIKPDLLVMDEDATPMKRIALAMVRRYGGKSYVVQHGAPVARFGFAPLEADGFFAWGGSSREQLVEWDTPTERIFVTGSPTHDALYREFRKTPRKNVQAGAAPKILLLATVPPRDCRPDLIEMNMNSRTYGEMIEAAFAGAEAIPGATLVVKPHPRTDKDPAVGAAALRHPKLRVETCRTASLTRAMRGVDCVLSCLSSAGIEATLAGVPVIQLVPRGAGRILPCDRWALFGSASNAKELMPLIRSALQGRGPSTAAALGDVFANAAFWGRKSAQVPDAATRIADVLLDRVKQSTHTSRTDEEQGRSKAIADR